MTALLADPWVFALAAGLFGLAIGSFLNVVIHRLPIMMEREWAAQCAELRGEAAPAHEPLSLVRPRSRCPACGHRIGALENVPILSWLLLRGRCKACGERISARYPLIEAVTAALFAFAAWRFGFGPAGLAALGLVAALIALAAIDFDTQLLPDDITLPLVWAGLALNALAVFTDLRSALFGAMAGYLLLWTVYWLFKLTTGREGMGYGDFKLLAALGAWFGWQMLPLVVLASSLVGAVVGIGLLVFGGHRRETPIPFGPYLALAGGIALFWGKSLTRVYLGVAL